MEPDTRSPVNDEHAVDESSPEAAEETTAKSDYGAMWLLVGVVAMVAATLWMIRDVWTSKPIVAEIQSEQGGSPTSAEPVRAAGKNGQPAATDSASKAEAAQQAFDSLRRQNEESLLEAKRQAALIEQERLEAEQELEQERTARAELERQRLETEKKLEEERLALEQARLAAEKKLEAERLALEKARRVAEQKLAEERAARRALENKRAATERKLSQERAERAALERRAAVEKQKLQEARQETAQAVYERALADEALKAEQSRAMEKMVDGRSAETPGTDTTSLQATLEDATAGSESEMVESDRASDAGKFSSNPCDGPSAKFLSTCR